MMNLYLKIYCSNLNSGKFLKFIQNIKFILNFNLLFLNNIGYASIIKTRIRH